jgi:hypothetical protein
MNQGLDFIIAGVQKGGTTALDALLRRHPRVRMASVKETHFFDDDDRNWTEPDYGVLHAYFDWTEAHVLRGESTPIYTYWPNCLERIRTYAPSIKLLVSLRHPSFRAFSQWRMETTRGSETLPFGEAIRSGRNRGGTHDRVYSYVERGFYTQQVERLQSLFPRTNILFLKTDDLWRDPRAQMNRITSFLGISPLAEVDKRYIVPLQSANLGKLLPADRKFLDSLFREDIEQTALLTGLDLSDWTLPDYSEPMIAPSERNAADPPNYVGMTKPAILNKHPVKVQDVIPASNSEHQRDLDSDSVCQLAQELNEHLTAHPEDANA